MITVTANLNSLVSSVYTAGYAVFTLVGYSRYVPRYGSSIIAETRVTVNADGSGNISVPLIGNDAISPSNTRYQIDVYSPAGFRLGSGVASFTGTGTVALTSLPQTFPTGVAAASLVATAAPAYSGETVSASASYADVTPTSYTVPGTYASTPKAAVFAGGIYMSPSMDYNLTSAAGSYTANFIGTVAQAPVSVVVLSQTPSTLSVTGTVNGTNTVFTFSAPASPTPQLAVFAGGIFQSSGDYTLSYLGSSTWQISFTVAPQFAPVSLLSTKLSTIAVTGTVDGSNTAFTFSATQSPSPNPLVFAGGVYQSASDYTLSYVGANTWQVSFTVAPTVGPVAVLANLANVTVTGTLVDISNVANAGVVTFILCGFGDSAPATVTQRVQAAADGTWSLTLWATDQLQPSGTYYQTEIDAASGDKIIVAAYQFPTSGNYVLGNVTQLSR